MSFRDEMAKMQERCHNAAQAKGWYKTQRSPLEFHMLMVSELAEATEECRSGRPLIYQFQPVASEDTLTEHLKAVHPNSPDWQPARKPEGEAIELADLFIRLMDYCQHRGIDLAEAVEMKLAYNKTRSERHGGKLY